MTWLKASGTISYYDSGWIVVYASRDLMKYYRKLGELEHLSIPKHGAHITIVNGGKEDPRGSPAWRKYEEQEITFEYSIDVGYEDGFWWLTIRSEELHNIREELGLARDLYWPLHITLANNR